MTRSLVVLQVAVDGLEGRSTVEVLSPADGDQADDGGRRVDGHFHAVFLHDDLGARLQVVQARVGLGAVGVDLPDEHAERPHVRLAGEDAVLQRLGRQPLYGHAAQLIVLHDLLVVGHAEVGDLQLAFGAEQTVARRHVAMDALLAFQVGEHVGRLDAEAEALGGVDSDLVLAQVGEQRVAERQLHDDHERLLVHGDAQDAHDVPVRVATHETRLPHELEPRLSCRLLAHGLDGHLDGAPALRVGRLEELSEGACSDGVVVEEPVGPLDRSPQSDPARRQLGRSSRPMPFDEVGDGLFAVGLDVEAAAGVLVDHEVLDSVAYAHREHLRNLPLFDLGFAQEELALLLEQRLDVGARHQAVVVLRDTHVVRDRLGVLVVVFPSRPHRTQVRSTAPHQMYNNY